MTQVFTEEEVKKHTTQEDCWLIIGGNVYDVTKFLDDHPGGVDTILDQAGIDATDEFEAVGHSQQALEMLPDYKIGTVEVDPNKPARQLRQAGGAGASGSSNVLALLIVAVACAVGYYFISSKKQP
eukprot:NODE_6062_length_534_cov_15.746392_g5309_i0.p1 GENE.NODE_6062_length_534_cov_15.746392_g5309_i0~~NODE_6062_length_534_cov_15.746392_g5309_i0.p1  ORF type:complete len:126 (+),score=24.72 NODE_6062_length_534_cov_15.746392_g5309_i0:63-440(+)